MCLAGAPFPRPSFLPSPTRIVICTSHPPLPFALSAQPLHTTSQALYDILFLPFCHPMDLERTSLRPPTVAAGVKMASGCL